MLLLHTLFSNHMQCYNIELVRKSLIKNAVMAMYKMRERYFVKHASGGYVESTLGGFEKPTRGIVGHAGRGHCKAFLGALKNMRGALDNMQSYKLFYICEWHSVPVYI